MKNFIGKMRNKSPHTKERIAVFSALGITALVALFWISSLGSNLSTPEAKETFANNVSPFKVLKDNLSAAVIRTESSLSSIGNKIGVKQNTDTSTTDTTATVDADGVVVIGAQE